MTTFTSSLPEATLALLHDLANKLDVPKNQIINDALTKYFYEYERQQFMQSFDRVAQDQEMTQLAEMGLIDFIEQIKEQDADR